MEFFADQAIDVNWSLTSQTTAALARMLAAFVFAVIAAYCYKTVQRRERVITDNLPYTMILFSVIVCGMMMIIGDSMARAFGLVGVLSMLRFRLNIKNPIEMAAVLFTITIGIACGMNLIALAAVFTVLVIAIFFVLHIHKSRSYHSRRRLLLRTKNHKKTHEFLDKCAANYGLSYKILSMEDLRGDTAIWKLDVTFTTQEKLTKWQKSLQFDQNLFYSEEKFEINLDLTQWKPAEKPLKKKNNEVERSSSESLTPLLSGVTQLEQIHPHANRSVEGKSSNRLT